MGWLLLVKLNSVVDFVYSILKASIRNLIFKGSLTEIIKLRHAQLEIWQAVIIVENHSWVLVTLNFYIIIHFGYCFYDLEVCHDFRSPYLFEMDLMFLFYLFLYPLFALKDYLLFSLSTLRLHLFIQLNIFFTIPYLHSQLSFICSNFSDQFYKSVYQSHKIHLSYDKCC